MPGVGRQEAVSVVVPVYNCEAYIGRCIESILNQSYDNLELILMDDGSPDRSGEICDQYAGKDTRIRVFHGKNRGAAAVREEGAKRVGSDYIAFVDSDDYIEADYIETLMAAILEEQGDVVCSDYIDEGNRGKTPRIEKRESLCRTEEMLKAFFKGMEFALVINGKIFKRELLDQLQFEDMRYGEDSFLMLDCFTKCKKMVLIPYSGYHYVMNPNSITNSGSELFRWRDWMRRVEFLREICSRPELEMEFREKAERMYAHYLFASLCVNCKYATEKEFREFSEAYRVYYAGICAGAVKNPGKAFVMWIFSWNSRLARHIVRLHTFVKKTGSNVCMRGFQR